MRAEDVGKGSPTPDEPQPASAEDAWRSFVDQAVEAWSIPASPDEPDPWVELIDRLWEANPYSKLLPVDPGEIASSFRQLWLHALRQPGSAREAWARTAEQYGSLHAYTVARMWGLELHPEPVARAEPGDRRFSAPDWERNVAFDALKQAYLIASAALLRSSAEVGELDPKARRKLQFYLRQFIDAISPTNGFFTNPQVLHETLQSGGKNVVAGLEHLRRDLAAGQIKMTDTDAFAPGRNLATTPGWVVHRNRLAELIQYAPATERVRRRPLLIVPPWINKYYVLDLQHHNSLIRFLVDQGYTVFVVSWKNPDASMNETTFDDYLRLGLLEPLQVVRAIADVPSVNVVGYCIGGTLLGMALAYLAEKGDPSVNAATFLVSLLDFSDVGDTAVFVDEPQVAYIEGQMLERGYLDSQSMATMFNLLRANDLIWSNVVTNYLLGGEPPAFDLLYWNNDGTRMTPAAHSFYLRNTYLENNLVKPGAVVLDGVPIDLSRVGLDVYAVGTEQDHIVPWKAAWQVHRLFSGPVRFVVGGSGHIAGVINPPTKGRGYWTNDQPAETPEAWLEGSTRHDGSWWTDWLAWLEPRSGEEVAARSWSRDHPPLEPAPGRYVVEK